MALLIALMGCDQIGNPLTMIEGAPPPDEFQVVARKPLRMPGSLSLPEPRLGEPSPLEPTPGADAIAALYGPSTAAHATTPSAGEQALLTAANANATDPAIRRVIQEDLARADSEGPYEAPSLFDLLGVTGAPIKDALDPQAESRRLQAEGIAAAPIDPADRGEQVRTQEPEAPPDANRYPVTGFRGVPRNVLPSQGTTPAFE